MIVFYIVLAILLFGLLIFVHEFGHFITAKLFGVRVNEFSMFMGPAIWKKQKGETLYALRCIPIGGYCAMEGEDGDSDDPRSFTNAAIWKRFIILIAGVFMETSSAIIILTPVFLPLIRALGISTLHFGVLFVVGIAIGMITPPVAINLFVASGITNLPLTKISKAVIPYLLGLIAVFLFIVYGPLFIPGFLA